MISAVTLAPRQRRLGLYWDMQAANYTTGPVKAFVEAVQRRLRRPILLIWDRLGAHRSAARQWREEGNGRIAVEWLPAYAPELNPAEQVWGHTKWADLANDLPADLKELGGAIDGSLSALEDEPQRLRSFFKASGLVLE